LATYLEASFGGGGDDFEEEGALATYLGLSPKPPWGGNTGSGGKDFYIFSDKETLYY
jgi:hypothetical protein